MAKYCGEKESPLAQASVLWTYRRNAEVRGARSLPVNTHMAVGVAEDTSPSSKQDVVIF
jgi:hypothetical protein